MKVHKFQIKFKPLKIFSWRHLQSSPKSKRLDGRFKVSWLEIKSESRKVSQFFDSKHYWQVSTTFFIHQLKLFDSFQLFFFLFFSHFFNFFLCSIVWSCQQNKKSLFSCPNYTKFHSCSFKTPHKFALAKDCKKLSFHMNNGEHGEKFRQTIHFVLQLFSSEKKV